MIGGGDWAENRLIPDCVRSTSLLKKLNIRNPNSTRPWQHVLEPLSGYINLGYALSKNLKLNNEAFNFGPPSKNNFSVINVIKEMKKTWEKINFKVLNKNFIKESSLLSLNCTKAVKKLKWTPTLTFAETIKETVIWYKKFYNNDYNNLLDLSKKQIVDYVNLAKKRNKDWSK